MALQPFNIILHVEERDRNGGDRVSLGGFLMSKELPFLIFCIEEYRLQKKLSGKEVMELFEKYSVCEYIYRFFELLHIHGNKYIVNDIDEYIESQKAS